MKKIFLLVTVTLCALASMATNYTGNLKVTVNGTTAQQNSTISLDLNSGNCNLLLKNFVYKVNGTTKNIGNIAINGIPTFSAGANALFYAYENVNITAGDASGVSSWIGPQLGAVPVKVVGRVQGDYAVVDFEMQLQDEVFAMFENVGDHFQIPNSDFEGWKASSGEPDHWHGFKSASGLLAGSAKGTLESSTAVRPGVTGKCALITSGSTFGIVNNGTMTNGQLNAASMSASNPANHSHMDINSTAVDKNGDPFYTTLYAAPDAIKTWIKYTQGNSTGNDDFHANLSAIAFDGNYYQDPEDKAYTNVAAKAVDTLIVRGDWRELTIPFDYNSYAANNAAAQAILITISTNAKPGVGFSGDKVWVDDMELVYNANVTNLTYQGAAIEGFDANTHEYIFAWESETAPKASDFALTVEGKSAVTAVSVQTIENGYRVVAMATSGDLMTANAYAIDYLVPAVVIPGDVNDDGDVNVIDITALIDIIMNDGTNPRADVNGDGEINVIDITALIDIIMNS